MTRIFFITLLLLSSFDVYSNNDKQLIEEVLNSFHLAAADANEDLYLASMTKDAVFLGTDASERWTKSEFKDFVHPHFKKGNGWLYTPIERNITLLTAPNIAYFDELLNSQSYGKCRGTGVLIKTLSGWKISQYNLSVPLPNPIAKKLVETIKKFESEIQ